MAEHTPGGADAGDQLVRIDDADMHVAEDGAPAWRPRSPNARSSGFLTQFPGRLLWRLRTEASVRKAVRTGFTRPVDIPDAFVEHALEMTHRDFVGAMRGPLTYLGQRSLPDRLTKLGIPLLVIFGTEDQRWRSSLASAYQTVPGARVELLPGAGHSPMLEDPQTTGKLLLDFASAVGHPS